MVAVVSFTLKRSAISMAKRFSGSNWWLQVEHERFDPWAILCGGGDALGKGRFRLRAAARATAGVGTMLGHQQGLGVGEVEHLPGSMARGHGLVQGRAAAGAGLWEMVGGGIGVLNLAQGLAWVAALSAGLLARGRAQALRAWGLLQPIAGRRLAAVGAGLAKLALQFRDAACQGGNQFLQHLDLCLLCCDDLLRRRKGGRSSVINWPGLGIRWRRHGELDSCPESPVKPLTDRAHLGSYKIHRIIAATDCGHAVNPQQIAAQVEGSFVYGLTALLYGEITLKDGKVEQENFDTYPMMRMDEMPQVESIIMPSGDFWGGVGEPTIFVAAPAVLNAIFAATGKRIRSVPLSKADLRKA